MLVILGFYQEAIFWDVIIGLYSLLQFLSGNLVILVFGVISHLSPSRYHQPTSIPLSTLPGREIQAPTLSGSCAFLELHTLVPIFNY